MSEEKQIILPDGFERVEFLEDVGLAWIDTGYIPNNETGLYVDAQQLVHADTIPIGCRKDSNNTRFYVSRWLKSTANSCGYGWGAWTSWGTVGNGSRFEGYTNFYNERVAKLAIKGVIKHQNNLDTLSFTPNTPICLFNVVNSKTDSNQWKGRIYEAKITQDNELIRHFIPCLDNNNRPCMYDLVSQQAFYNQGSGRFLTNKDYNLHNNLNPYTLPYGFKKCVYLQSNGTQWIDTGVNPNNETGIYFKALQLSYGNFVPFGVTDGDNTIYPPRYNNKDVYYKYGTTAIKMFTWDNADDLIFQSSLNFYNSKTAFFNSEDTGHLEYLSSQSGIFAYPIWLFSYNIDGSFSTTYGAWSGRIYRAQITQGNTLIRDYIPCLDADGRPCMWDSINDVAYYNQSGGTEFTYCVEHQLPSDFSKLKYLESTGTQYIKTGYVPTNTTGLYVDCFNNSKVTSSVVPMGLRDTNGNTYFASPRTAKNSDAGYGWGTFTSWGGKGDVRFEGTTNWLNDRKAILTSPAFAYKVASLSDLPFTPTKDIYIFGIHNYDGKYLSGSWKFYRAKISEGSEVVRDFVPALDTRLYKPCMYDLINNAAYYNDGSDEFLYGNNYEGTYTDSAELGCIGNRLGSRGFLWQIPKDYKRLLYLESNGTQWIDTDIVLNSPNIDFEIEFMAYDSNKFRLLQSGSNFTYTLSYISIPINDTKKSTLNIQMPELNKKHKAIFRNNLFILDGVEQTEIYNGTIEDLTTTVTATTKIFAFTNPTAATNYKDQWFSGRVYSCKLSVDGELLRNFIPCLDYNDTPCLYDTVTERTFYNQGTGDNFSYKKL